MKSKLISLFIVLMMSMMLMVCSVKAMPSGGGFADNFNDNSLDTTRWETFQWIRGEGYSGEPLPEIYERNQRLEIYYNYPSPWVAYGGILTKDKWNMADSFLSVQAVLNNGWRAFILISPEKKSGFVYEPAWCYMYEFIRENYENVPNDYGCVRVWRYANYQWKSLYQGWGDYKRVGFMRIQIVQGTIKFYINAQPLVQETYALNTYDLHIYLGANFYIDSGDGEPVYYYGTVAFDNFKLSRFYAFVQDYHFVENFNTNGKWKPLLFMCGSGSESTWVSPTYAKLRATEYTGYEWATSGVGQGIPPHSSNPYKTGIYLKYGAQDDFILGDITLRQVEFDKDNPIPSGKYLMLVMVAWTELEPSGAIPIIWKDPIYDTGINIRCQYEYYNIATGEKYLSEYENPDVWHHDARGLPSAINIDLIFDRAEHDAITGWYRQWEWEDSYFHYLCKYDSDIHVNLFYGKMPSKDVFYGFQVDLKTAFEWVFNNVFHMPYEGGPLYKISKLYPRCIEYYTEGVAIKSTVIVNYVWFMTV